MVRKTISLKFDEDLYNKVKKECAIEGKEISKYIENAVNNAMNDYYNGSKKEINTKIYKIHNELDKFINRNIMNIDKMKKLIDLLKG